MKKTLIASVFSVFLLVGVIATLPVLGNFSPDSSQPQSVEIKLLALQASNNEFGYAVPASGGSAPSGQVCREVCFGGGDNQTCRTSCSVAPPPRPPGPPRPPRTGPLVLFGCTNQNAVNFNPNALLDDGSCVASIPTPPPTISGCTLPDSLNYNPNATVNNGSCIARVTGCMNPLAQNYDSTANTSGPCTLYPAMPTVTISAESNLVRSGSQFEVQWNPNGWLGTCSLFPAFSFQGVDPNSAGSSDITVDSTTAFLYRCTAPSGVYANSPTERSSQVRVEVIGTFQEI